MSKEKPEKQKTRGGGRRKKDAVSRAVEPRTSTNDERSRLRVGVVCKEQAAVLDMLIDDAFIEVAWVAELGPDKKGTALAREMDVPVVGGYSEVADVDVGLIIDVTGSPEVAEGIEKKKSPGTELLSGHGAGLVRRLLEDRKRRLVEKERVSRVNESFYHLGLIIENISTMGEAGYVIVEYATKLTNTPAAVLALMDDQSEEMIVISSKGFGLDFEKIKKWGIGQCELTKKILGSDGPFYVKDLTEYPHAMPFLISEGVRTLLAVPLTLEGRNIGAIITADFEEHKFKGEDLSTLSLFGVYAAITIDRVRSIEQMRRQSQTDGLTGLYNQRYLMEQLRKELQRASRHGHKLSVIMLDVDYFKRYNDTFGHLEGNKVLKQVAKVLSRDSRFADTVGRFGGEEFCLILPEVEKEGATAFAERILKDVAHCQMPKKNITLSAGVGTFPEDGRDHITLLSAADSCLYKAKKEGRNRVR